MTTEAKWADFASGDRAKTIAAANALLPAWVSLLLIVVIAWQLARIVWLLVPGPSAGAPVSAPPPSISGSAGGSDAVNVAAIAAAHLFGEASGEPAPPPTAAASTENLQETRLTNLSLRGTLAADPADRGAAIIADGRNDEKVYFVGQAVTSGAKLHSVYTDRVVLDESGVLTNLKLTRDYASGSSTPSRRAPPVTPRTVEADPTSMQSVVAENVTALADVIRPTPYFVNGQQEGYRVYPGRNRAQFAALGLRPGDLIKDIDGQALTDPTQAMQIFQSLGSVDQVSVTVERNGQQEVIVLSTSQLELSDETSQ